MNNCLPWDTTATDADGGEAAAGARAQIVRRLIVVMLLTAATLDLTRCGLVIAAARYPAPTAGLITAGLAAAALTVRTARGCQAGQHWAGWAALLIGVASAPASSRIRLPQPLHDSRLGHRCPGNTAGRHHLGDRGPDGPPGHDTENPPVTARGATR